MSIRNKKESQKRRRTKIVCTIGPASRSPKLIEELIREGMDVARLNFSHGNHAEHSLVIRHVREISRRLKKQVAILQDLGGPKIRTGLLRNGPIVLKEGQTFTLTTRQVPGNEKETSLSHPLLLPEVRSGNTILLADGSLELRVEEVTSTDIKCRVISGGTLTSQQGINLPDADLEIPLLSKKDQRDLLFGINQKVDFIGISFVRQAQDILQVRKILKKKAGEGISLIAKIEKRKAVSNIDKIIEVADAIMIARGDLGVEIPLEEVPLAQKAIIRKCNLAGKPVITATQMLESMVRNPRPTRAEVTDVANAIFDGTDAVMLSEETALGKYPLKSIRIMNKIAIQTEESLDYEKILQQRALSVKATVPDAVSNATCQIAHDLKAAAILIFTLSGSTARLVARYRPGIPIMAGSPEESTARKLALSWGVYPHKSQKIKDTDDMICKAKNTARRIGRLGRGEIIVITAGIPFAIPGITNLIKVEIMD